MRRPHRMSRVVSCRDNSVMQVLLPLSDPPVVLQPRSRLPSPPGDPFFDTLEFDTPVMSVSPVVSTPEFDTPEISVSPVVNTPEFDTPEISVSPVVKTLSISSSNSSSSNNSPTSIATTIEYFS